MESFSLQPDPDMRWIYDSRHPEYNSERARELRWRRGEMLAICPIWLLAQAAYNDELRKLEKS